MARNQGDQTKLDEIITKISDILYRDNLASNNRKQIYCKLGLSRGGDYTRIDKASGDNCWEFFHEMLILHFGGYETLEEGLNLVCQGLEGSESILTKSSLKQIKALNSVAKPVSNSKSVKSLSLAQEPSTSSKAKLSPTPKPKTKANELQVQQCGSKSSILLLGSSSVAENETTYKLKEKGSFIGHALILNFARFRKPDQTRRGAIRDRGELESLFEKLNLDWTTVEDLTLCGFKKEINKFIKTFDPLDPYKVCVVVIQSFGYPATKGSFSFLTRDKKEVSVNKELLPMFDDSHVEIKKKPKIFILDFDTNFGAGGDVGSETEAHKELHDIFWVNASLHPNPLLPSVSGTWFIRTFCKIVGAKYRSNEIKVLMELVQKSLDREYKKGTIDFNYKALDFGPFYFKETP